MGTKKPVKDVLLGRESMAGPEEGGWRRGPRGDEGMDRGRIDKLGAENSLK